MPGLPQQTAADVLLQPLPQPYCVPAKRLCDGLHELERTLQQPLRVERRRLDDGVQLVLRGRGELAPVLARQQPPARARQGVEDEQLGRRRQPIRDRLASTLDMPKSVAAGRQDESNHWTAWQVEESTYKIFIEPLLRELGDAITTQWFRPALVAMGMSAEQSTRY